MMSIEDFKAAFRLQPAGLALITARWGEKNAALTASSLSAVSAAPPLLMFSISTQSSAVEVIRRAETAVVHLLSAENRDLAELGATSGIDRFADTSQWSPLDTGEPVFRDVPAWMRIRMVNRLPAGEAVIVIGEVQEVHIDKDRAISDGLVYQDRTWHRIGPHSHFAAQFRRSLSAAV